ncbi:hypothetical protein [Asaia lannensis]|uniref:hypothetical protein n=1 Tax=Asaia lannensis TaxID=415421 RepID=UPI0038733FEF
MSVRSAALAVTGANRRLRNEESATLFDNAARAWRHAWDAAWRGPACSKRELSTRARLALQDPEAMDHAEIQRLARDVLKHLQGLS